MLPYGVGLGASLDDQLVARTIRVRCQSPDCVALLEVRFSTAAHNWTACPAGQGQHVFGTHDEESARHRCSTCPLRECTRSSDYALRLHVQVAIPFSHALNRSVRVHCGNCNR